jgi:hypothetical protein
MVKLTKEFELTIHDIIFAIRQLPPIERKVVLDTFIDEKTGIKGIKFKDIPLSIDVETMMKERGYTGINWQRFDKLVEKLNFNEPIEDILKDLD